MKGERLGTGGRSEGGGYVLEGGGSCIFFAECGEIRVGGIGLRCWIGSWVGRGVRGVGMWEILYIVGKVLILTDTRTYQDHPCSQNPYHSSTAPLERWEPTHVLTTQTHTPTP